MDRGGRAALLWLGAWVTLAGCGSAPRCVAYVARGQGYCAYTEAEEIAAAPDCPSESYRPIYTPRALVCAPQESGAHVPPEL